jgi:hypothetical protein
MARCCLCCDSRPYYCCARSSHPLAIFSAGEFNPRVAKCREALLLLQRRCHAADVRDYHNRCVQRWQHMGSALRDLPPEATTSQRLTYWKEAEEGADVVDSFCSVCAAAGHVRERVAACTRDACATHTL